MESRLRPYRPTAAEQEGYFNYLAGYPKLLARSSGTPWEPWTWTNPYRKQLHTLGNHEIVEKWSTEVEEKLMQALEACDWRAFYPICIGVCSDEDLRSDWKIKADHLNKTYPAVLMVVVEENDSTWDKLVEIALACRAVLEEAGISGVEVEMRSGQVVRYASAIKELETAVKDDWEKTAHDDEFDDAINYVLPRLGCAIGPTSLTRRGTLGLFLRLVGDAGDVYGLTCRHVALPPEVGVEAKADYAHSGAMERIKIGLATSGLEIAKRFLEERKNIKGSYLWVIDRREERFQTLGDERYRLSEGELATRKSYAAAVAYATRLIDKVDRILAMTPETLNRVNRELGYTAYSREWTVGQRDKFIRDWALVKLDQSQFANPLANQVYIGGMGTAAAFRHLRERKFSYDILDLSGYLRIQGTVNWQPGQRKSLYVGKRGSTTGLTYGQTNEIEAVLREPLAGSTIISRSMLAVSLRQGRFSAPGDSGSCVWTFDGKVVGIIDRAVDDTCDLNRKPLGKKHTDADDALPANASQAEENPDIDGFINGRSEDVTFIQPISCVIRDIEDLTGRTVEIL